MKQYIKDNKIINATDKAYRVIYKPIGFKPFEAEEKAEEIIEDEVEEVAENVGEEKDTKPLTEKELRAYNNDKAIAMLQELGIEISSRANKDEIVEVARENGLLGD